MLLDVLSKSELIELIGNDIYEQTADFLESIFSGADDEEDLQFSRKRNVVKLALSFVSSSSLKRPEFWKDIIRRLDQSDQNMLDRESGIRLDLPGGVLVDRCLRFEFGRYGMRTDILTDDKKTKDAVTLCKAPEHPFQRLKEYQQDIYCDVLSKLEIPRNRLIIQMPTGSGKTRTAMEVVCEVLNLDRSKNILWLAHSVDLVDQAAESFSEVWAHLGLFDVNLRLVDGERRGLDYADDMPSFVVSTFQSMISYLSRSNDTGFEFLSGLSLVVVDEAHMSLAPTYNQLIRTLISKGSRLVGLTATPGRGRDVEMENQQLADFYLNNTVNLASPDNRSVFSYLRNIGVMSRTRMEELPGSILNLSDSEVKKIQQEFSIPTSVLSRLGMEERRNIHIILRLRTLLNENSDHKIILFSCSVDHSKFIVSVCMYLGFSAAHIDGGTPPNRRRAIINDFRNGDIQILSNFGVLSTGFDAPKTDVVFIARPTASIVLYSQMIGRGLRGPTIGGTERCLIVNVRDNLIGMPNPDDIYDYFAEYYVN